MKELIKKAIETKYHDKSVYNRIKGKDKLKSDRNNDKVVVKCKDLESNGHTDESIENPSSFLYMMMTWV